MILQPDLGSSAGVGGQGGRGMVSDYPKKGKRACKSIYKYQLGRRLHGQSWIMALRSFRSAFANAANRVSACLRMEQV